MEVTPVAERHLVSAQVPLELLEIARQNLGRGGRMAEMGERRVATADAEGGAAAGDRVDGGDGGGGDGGVAREGIGDAGAEPDARGLAGRHRQADVAITREVLGVDDGDPIPAIGLGAPGALREGARHPGAIGPELDRGHRFSHAVRPAAT